MSYPVSLRTLYRTDFSPFFFLVTQNCLTPRTTAGPSMGSFYPFHSLVVWLNGGRKSGWATELTERQVVLMAAGSQPATDFILRTSGRKLSNSILKVTNFGKWLENKKFNCFHSALRALALKYNWPRTMWYKNLYTHTSKIEWSKQIPAWVFRNYHPKPKVFY